MRLSELSPAFLSYLFWRLAYIAIKPLAILLAAKLLDGSSASLLSLAIAISGTLMASLSFGTYRLLFRTRGQNTRTEQAELLRKGTFLFNGIIVCLCGAVASLVFGLETAAFVSLFVITEHVVHDESRILLYAGSRERWARENCLRTLFVLVLPIVVYFSKGYISLLAALLIAAVLNAILSTVRGGLFRVRTQTFSVLMRWSFYRAYRRRISYFMSATLNRFNQQSDRYIYSFLSFETLWVYSLVAQIGNLPLMFYEMSHMSKLKESVAQERTHRFQWLPRRQVVTLTGASGLAFVVYIFVGATTPEIFEPLFIALLFFILTINYIASTSMFNGERLFWAMHDAKKFARLEVSASLAGLVAAIPVAVSGMLFLVNIPKALSLIVRIRNTRQWLRP